MTANLLHEHGDVADFARVLGDYDPDVVVTQELGPGPARVLADAYPHHRLRPAVGFTGRGIATRLDVEFGNIPMPGRDGTSALLRVEDLTVRLAGVHLLNPIHFPWWVSARNREAQLDGLFEWVHTGSGPTVVAGDFNASPRWAAYKRMSRHFDDLVVEWAGANERRVERTWAWRPGWPLLLRIDHVFGSGVEAANVEVVEIRGTDHRGIVVDLEVNPD
jgi:endonuclease/exonuclease/phosphatase (EEP) superfamily protein YafD